MPLNSMIETYCCFHIDSFWDIEGHRMKALLINNTVKIYLLLLIGKSTFLDLIKNRIKRLNSSETSKGKLHPEVLDEFNI